MKKSICGAFIAVGIIAISSIFAAGEETSLPADYQRLEQEYGDSVSSYTYTIPTVSQGDVTEIYSAEGEIKTVTESCHVRLLPDRESQSVIILETGTQVQVWGYTSNDWSKIICKKIFISEDGANPPVSEFYSGYIKSTLLS